MKKFMKIKHNVAQFIDNLGKNTILIATRGECGLIFDEIKTENSKKEILECLKHCPGQYLIAFNGKLVMNNAIPYASEVEFVEFTDEDIAEMEKCYEDCAYSPDYHYNKGDCIEREVKDDTN